MRPHNEPQRLDILDRPRGPNSRWCRDRAVGVQMIRLPRNYRLRWWLEDVAGVLAVAIGFAMLLGMAVPFQEPPQPEWEQQP